MRLGLLAVATETGLGYQTRDYYRHLNPSKTIVIDISSLNGRAQHPEWYSETMKIRGIPTDNDLDAILDDIDVLLTAETPYNLNLYTRARERGIKTVCVENPEFYDHIKFPNFAMPDLIILPSVWLESTIREHAESRGTRVVQLHHPVDREVFPFRLRTTKTFVHIAGQPAANDRNGTHAFMEACHDGVVTTQNSDLAWSLRSRYRHATIYDNIQNPMQLYTVGDVMVMPRRYGGNCLPLNEALSTGMPVIMPDISPNNHLLPPEWLVPAYKVDSFEPRFPVDIYSVDHDALVEKINWFKSCDIERESYRANAIADRISWKTLQPEWIKAIEGIL